MAAEIHRTAIVEPGARLANGVTVGPFTTISPRAPFGSSRSSSSTMRTSTSGLGRPTESGRAANSAPSMVMMADVVSVSP